MSSQIPTLPATAQPTNVRWSTLHLFFATSIAAVFFAALFSENQWCRAILGTTTSAMIINSLIAAIFSRGEKRAYSLGYFIGATFCPMIAYTSIVSLPYMITVKFLEYLNTLVPSPFDSTNFYVVSALFWVQATCFSTAFLALSHYRALQKFHAATIPCAERSETI